MNRREILKNLMGTVAIGELFNIERSFAGFGGFQTSGPTSYVTIDAVASSPAHVSGANSISLNSLTVGTGNALLVFISFGYSNHSGYTAVWDAGGTNQSLVFLLTSDNGPSAPAIAIMALGNPTPGNKTLTVTWTGAADNVVLYAVSLNNVSTIGMGFVAANFATGTSNAASFTLPAVLGGIQFVTAAGLSGSGTPTSWDIGTQIYSDAVVGTWGTGVYHTADQSKTFTQSINASEFWAIAGVIAYPAHYIPLGTLAVDSSNPLSSGLTAAIPCVATGTLTDLVSAKTATTSGGCSTNKSGGFGGGVAFPSTTSDRADFGVFQPIVQGDYTILALCNPSPTGTQGVIAGQVDGNTASAFACLQANSDKASSGLVQGEMAVNNWNGTASNGCDDGKRIVSNGTYHTGLIDGGYHCFAGRIASGVATQWSDGCNTTIDQSTVTGTYVNVSQHFAVGNLGNYTSGNLSADCTVVLVLVWSRALSDDEMIQITSNPFQVLKGS